MPRKKFHFDKIKELRDKGLSYSEIAKMYDSSDDVVRRFCKIHGLSNRDYAKLSGAEAVEMSLMDRVKQAIVLLRGQEPPEGYWLGFSGGKDSLVCYWLLVLSEVKFEAHYALTGTDAPETMAFIRSFPDVIIDLPERTMFQLIEDKGGFLPTRKCRYCCDKLKEMRAKDRWKVLGVRADESANRRGRDIVDRKRKEVLPIYGWSDIDVWDFIQCNLLDYNPLYDVEGFERVGCIGCPLVSKRKRLVEFERYPLYKKAYIQAIERGLQKSGDKDKTAHELFEAWLNF